jgi:hypothetical protein
MLTMAKKNPDGPAPATRRRAPRRSTASEAPPTEVRRGGPEPAAAPVDVASVGPVEPIDTAHDHSANGHNGSHQPSFEEIAEEAYRRYQSRGGTDGRDFDDWIEAERALTRRHAP